MLKKQKVNKTRNNLFILKYKKNIYILLFLGIPSSMLESVWSSMSNSVYSSPDSDYEESFDNAPESEQVSGLEVFTQAIESSKFELNNFI